MKFTMMYYYNILISYFTVSLLYNQIIAFRLISLYPNINNNIISGKVNRLNVFRKNNYEKDKDYPEFDRRKQKPINTDDDVLADLSQLVKLGDEERLQKLIARSGVSSRRGAESLVINSNYIFFS